jgi:predicted Co/Zn/Cd cation transporter (cation efflux family)
LRASLWVSIGLTAITLIVGVLTSSQLLIFEGAFGSIGLASTWFALQASRAADRKPTARFPYGLDALTPLVVAVQGFAVGATLVYAAVSAVTDILDGGHPVNAGAVAAVAGLAGVVGLIFAWWLRRNNPGSDLIEAERAQWKGGAIRALVAASGAALAILAAALSFDALLNYVDSILVLLAVAIVAPMPLKLIRHGVNELLEGAPDRATTAALKEAVESVTTALGLSAPRARATKMGLKVYLDVVYTVESPDTTIGFEDQVRKAMADAVAHLPLDVWVTVELTTARSEED